MVKEANQKIIKGIKNGDEKTISAFYEKYFPSIKDYILNNSGDITDAKDVFQDALVIIYQKIKEDDLKIHCAIGTYLYAICKNIWLNKLRKNGKILLREDIMTLDETDTSTILDDIERKEKIAVIQKYCLKLGSGCREILLLFFSGYSIKEISKLKNLTEGYTKKRKFACQQKLTAMIEKDPCFIELKASFKNK
ncbi:RNA polymerase sigma factor [Aquimarina sp. SS2-1]|uniref:RNA polymerase sigma factor n=1 Tax=Aquimarina besae TaxID=3342247 RepID=UPI0036706C3F